MSRKFIHAYAICGCQLERPGARFTMQGAKRLSLLCVPWFVFALGFFTPPSWKTLLWTTSLAFVGVVCLVNARRCSRIHCLFTGPFFILGAIASLGYGLGFLPLGSSGWKWIGAVTIIGAIVLTCIPELVLGRYRRNRPDATYPMSFMIKKSSNQTNEHSTL